MATGTQVETLEGYISKSTQVNARAQVKSGLSAVGTNLSDLVNIKSLLDTVVTDAAAASKPDYRLEAIQTDWASNLVGALNGWSYSGKTGINALAQLVADLSEQAGLDGTASEMRIYRNGTVVAVDQDA